MYLTRSRAQLVPPSSASCSCLTDYSSMIKLEQSCCWRTAVTKIQTEHERQSAVRKRAMPQTTEVLSERIRTVQWMANESAALQLGAQTLDLAIDLLDRLLALMPVRVSFMRASGATCLLLASKMEEHDALTLDELVESCSDGTCKHRLVTLEKLFLEALEFRVRNLSLAYLTAPIRVMCCCNVDATSFPMIQAVLLIHNHMFRMLDLKLQVVTVLSFMQESLGCACISEPLAVLKSGMNRNHIRKALAQFTQAYNLEKMMAGTAPNPQTRSSSVRISLNSGMEKYVVPCDAKARPDVDSSRILLDV